MMLTQEQRQPLIDAIRRLPAQLEALVAPLSTEDLITPFLASEWTVAQNIHHLADSHMNSFIRLKLILSEDHPTLKPYDQDAWAAMPDSNHADIEDSLSLLRGLHRRWSALFAALDEAAWSRTGFHPENGDQSVEDLLRSYAAHGEGHVDQINRTLAARR
ncbi:MAG TPA: DinB family protein [Herpetosiphonaceae bacterium]